VHEVVLVHAKVRQTELTLASESGKRRLRRKKIHEREKVKSWEMKNERKRKNVRGISNGMAYPPRPVAGHEET
jgi:hypothetical protein